MVVYGINVTATCFYVHWAHYGSSYAERDASVGQAESKKKENATAAAVGDDDDDDVNNNSSNDNNNNNNEHAKFQASAAMYVRSALLWDLTQRREVILCRTFGLNWGLSRNVGTEFSPRCVISQRREDLNNNHDFHNCDLWPRQRNRKRDVWNGCHIVDACLSVYVTDMWLLV